jgi:hypothetical protein
MTFKKSFKRGRIFFICILLLSLFSFAAQIKAQGNNFLPAQSTQGDNTRQQEVQTQTSFTITLPLLVMLLFLLTLFGAMAGVLFNVRSSVATIQRDSHILQGKVEGLEETIKGLQTFQLTQTPSAKTQPNNTTTAQQENAEDASPSTNEPFILDQGTPSLNGLSLHNARAAYRALIAGNKLIPDPLFLKAEATSSLSDMFGKGEVFLSETEHGAFILLRATEIDKRGWVFPNPSLYYRGEALRPVFPNLKENDFNHRKQSIDPVAVSQVGKKRWVVGQNA